MKTLVIAALALMIGVSGCTNGKRCSCQRSDGKKGVFRAEGGAEWSGQATEGATVQFGRGGGMRGVVPTFTFTITNGFYDWRAASEMRSAIDNILNSECQVIRNNRIVSVSCLASPNPRPNPMEYIRFINYETESSGEWVRFEGTTRLAGGLDITHLPY